MSDDIDLVDRLRAADRYSQEYGPGQRAIYRMAADEIERLRAELDAIPADLIEATNEIGRLRAMAERCGAPWPYDEYRTPDTRGST